MLKQPSVAFILNSRGRPYMLSRCLDAIVETSQGIKYTVGVGLDDDDDLTLLMLDSYKRKFPLVNFFVTPRQLNLHERMWRTYVQLSRTDYVMVLNDDAIITEANWLETIRILETYSDGVILGKTDDNSVDKEGDYCSFPIQSSRAVGALGYVMSTKFSGLGGDVVANRIYSELDRTVNVPIKIDHILHNALPKVLNPDPTCAEMRGRSEAGCWTVDIEDDVDKLRRLLC